MDIIYRYDPYQPLTSPSFPDAEAAEKGLSDGNLRFGMRIEGVQAEMMGGDAARPLVIQASPLSLGFSMVPGQAPTQRPFAVVLGCSDARAPVEIIFDQANNSLFVVRVAGNVLGTECLGSVDYAVRYLGEALRLVVVLGHTGCGAVAAAVDLYLDPDGQGAIAASHALRSIVDRILVVVRIAAKAIERACGRDAESLPGYRAALWEMAVYLNAALTASDLNRELEVTGERGPRVVFGVYDLLSHRVHASPGDENTFGPAPENSAEFTKLSDLLAESLVKRDIICRI